MANLMQATGYLYSPDCAVSTHFRLKYPWKKVHYGFFHCVFSGKPYARIHSLHLHRIAELDDPPALPLEGTLAGLANEELASVLVQSGPGDHHAVGSHPEGLVSRIA